MAYFPDVVPGQVISRSALLENNIRHMVNAYNGFNTHGQLSGQENIVRITCYNAGTSAIGANMIVSFSGTKADGIIPAIPWNGSSVWGVAVNDIAVGSVGSVIVSGQVDMSCTGTGDYASPASSDLYSVTLGTDGVPVLYKSGSTATILVGQTGGTSGNIPHYDCEFGIDYNPETGEIDVHGGYVQGINGHTWVNSLNNIQEFEYTANKQYVVYFTPELGSEVHFNDSGNVTYDFKTFTTSGWNMHISESYIDSRARQSWSQLVTIYETIIGTFWTDDDGNIDLSSWCQIHAGTVYMPYLIPSGSSSKDPESGTTQDPQDPEEYPDIQFTVDSITYVSGGESGQESSYESMYESFIGDYKILETSIRTCYCKYQNGVWETNYSYQPNMSPGRCGFDVTVGQTVAQDMDLNPVNLQSYPQTGQYTSVYGSQTLVFDVVITWKTTPPV